MGSSFFTRSDFALMLLGAFDKGATQLQSPPQLSFFASHLAVIVFVVEAGQVKDSVQNQNFHFFRQRMSEVVGIVPGNVRGDRHLACNPSDAVCGSR